MIRGEDGTERYEESGSVLTCYPGCWASAPVTPLRVCMCIFHAHTTICSFLNLKKKTLKMSLKIFEFACSVAVFVIIDLRHNSYILTFTILKCALQLSSLFSTFTRLCHRRHSLVLFMVSKGTPVFTQRWLPLLPLPGPWHLLIYFCLREFVCLGHFT